MKVAQYEGYIMSIINNDLCTLILKHLRVINDQSSTDACNFYANKMNHIVMVVFVHSVDKVC